MKYIVIFSGSIILLLSSCTSKGKKIIEKPAILNIEKTDIDSSNWDKIVMECRILDSSRFIYDITFMRHKSQTIVYLHPTLSKEYINDKGQPTFFLEYKGILFLVYTGLNVVFKEERKALEELMIKFDSINNNRNIKNIHQGLYDYKPLFLVFESDSLVGYNNDFNFYKSFYNIKEDTTAFKPQKIN